MGNNLVGSFDIAVCGVTSGIFLTTAFMFKRFKSCCGGETRNQRGKKSSSFCCVWDVKILYCCLKAFPAGSGPLDPNTCMFTYTEP